MSYDEKKVEDLKGLCKQRGLAVTGKKDVLVKRLKDDDLAKAKKAAAKPASPKVSPKAAPAPVSNGNSPKVAPTSPKNKPEATTLATMSDAERAKLRAARFGTDNPDLEKEKQRQRAERFGLPNEDLEKERRKQRAERFGTHNEDVEAEKVKSRQERFGTSNETDKMKARQERFGTGAASNNKLDQPLGPVKRSAAANGDANDEESLKKKARMERFGTSAMSTEAQKIEARKARFA
ncbi:unnamed protein product [Amoebophrya sp. A25]|nr:unnamed protein product [Amoebophrya sp. A25]|eukprot:GSA25T00025018001.1